MLTSYIVGIGAIVVVSLMWVGVQQAWRRAFPEACSDPDVLAGRSDCHGCKSHGSCGRKVEEATG